MEIIDLLLSRINSFDTEILIKTKNLQIKNSNFRLIIQQIQEYLNHNGYSTKDTIILYQNNNLFVSIFSISLVILGIPFVIVNDNFSEADLKNIKTNLINTFLILNDSEIIEIIKRIVINDEQSNEEIQIQNKISNSDIAYYVHTSGSTGTSKLVPNTRYGLFNLVSCKQLNFIKNDDIILQYATPTFDAFIFECFISVCHKAILAIPDTSIKLDIVELADFIEEEKITTTLLIPQLTRQLINFADKLSHLKNLIVGADFFPAELARTIQEKLPNINVYNAYGPSENAVITLIYKVDYINDNWSSIPLGQPLDNVEIELLESDIDNNIFELIIKSKTLFPGYMKEGQFVLPNNCDKGFYRTGDLVFQKDNQIFFYSRNDNQRKINGFRVDLIQVTNCLCDITNCNCVVDVLKGKNDVLVGIIETKDNFDISSLRNKMGKVLKQYMIPSEFIYLESFPTTKNGKIDRKKILEDLQNKYQNKADSFLMILKKYSLDNQYAANLFEIGITSLQLIDMISELQSIYNIKISIGRLIESPTIANLISIMNNQGLNIQL